MEAFEAGKLVGQLIAYLGVVVVGIIVLVRVLRKNKKKDNDGLNDL